MPQNFRTLIASALTALALALLAGCEANALHEARMTDTPAAYEAFLQKYPDHEEAEWMRDRMEELRYMKAKDAGTSRALRDYITSHPEGAHTEDARILEDEVAFKEAEGTSTAASYQGYLDAHPDGKFLEKARYEYEEKMYLDKIALENQRVERINLANDPEGPKNGWGIFADVKNIGPRNVVEVEIVVHYLDDAGNSVDTDKWWAVAKGLMGMPTPPYIVPPLPPEAIREFKWTTGQTHEKWAQKVNLEITNLRFEDDMPGSVGK